MNYELAKKLKDAGFPQALGSMQHECGHEPLGHLANCPDKVYLPTLSELIEACGEDFGELRTDFAETQNRWCAVFNTNKDRTMNENFCIGYGPTPEEAVANLWLTLNKK